MTVIAFFVLNYQQMKSENKPNRTASHRHLRQLFKKKKARQLFYGIMKLPSVSNFSPSKEIHVFCSACQVMCT